MSWRRTPAGGKASSPTRRLGAGSRRTLPSSDTIIGGVRDRFPRPPLRAIEEPVACARGVRRQRVPIQVIQVEADVAARRVVSIRTSAQVLEEAPRDVHPWFVAQVRFVVLLSHAGLHKTCLSGRGAVPGSSTRVVGAGACLRGGSWWFFACAPSCNGPGGLGLDLSTCFWLGGPTDGGKLMRVSSRGLAPAGRGR